MSSITVGYDCIAANLPSCPAGQRCGYTSGAGIAWSAADWAANSGAVRIAQSPSLSTDEAGHPDVLDVEGGAATYADCGPWALAAQHSFAAASRPGQREPAVYCSMSNVINVVNALVAAGAKDVGLWVADWNWAEPQAVADVLAASGPYPIIGVQFADKGTYDVSVFATAWLDKVSGAVPVPTPPPPPAAGLSVTPHLIVNASWPEVKGAEHYLVTYAPAHGPSATKQVGQPLLGGIVHLANMVIPSGADMQLIPGKLTVTAVLPGRTVLVGVKDL